MTRRVTLVDTIGVHSGMDKYDLPIAGALQGSGWSVEMLSNFSAPSNGAVPPVLYNFYQGSLLRKLSLLVLSWLRFTVRVLATSGGRRWWIFQIYGLRWVDVLFLLPLLPSRSRIVLLIHDVYSIRGDESAAVHRIKAWFYRNVPRHVVVQSERAQALIESAGYLGRLLAIGLLRPRTATDLDDSRVSPDLRAAATQRPRLTLLAFGSLRHSKGLDTALDALRLLPPQAREHVRLLVVGRDSQQLLRTRAYRVDAQIPVAVVNRFVSDEEQTFAFRSADYLLLPYREIYQSGVLEVAVAHRLPILASDLDYFRRFQKAYPSFIQLFGSSAQDLKADIMRRLQRGRATELHFTEDDLRVYDAGSPEQVFTAAIDLWSRP